MKNTYCILIILLTVILQGCSSLSAFNDSKKAIYLTVKENSILKPQDLEENEVIVVNSFKELEEKFNSLSKTIPVLIDKNALNKTNTEGLNNWIPKQTSLPVIFVGYSNPTYILLKELDLYENKHMPPNMSDKQIEELKHQKGFSLMYITTTGHNYGVGFDKENTVQNILEITDQALKGDKAVEELMPEQ
ncbi:hypothetical protein RirG_002260 [Rhizophagus irregularis DAOM 197198w]|uniref:Lipoprotein n=1 Tax=Rhizophagus irregularis (strain DAOM 197198w) TaxID=1432141 RepID=A0A015NK25_RHIIW|nr:hypothetical protein RirG_002260 [Rhizophagus irregularis DAOM 197198w]